MKKRLFSIFMSICMVCCLIPALSVLAAGEFKDGVLDLSTLKRKIIEEEITILSIKERVPGNAETFNLNEDGSVVGYIESGTVKSESDEHIKSWKALYMSPNGRKGGKIIFPENCSGAFIESGLIGLNLEVVYLGGCVDSVDMSRVKCMDNMFCNCKRLESVNLGDLKADNVVSMNNMFCNCFELKSVILEGFTVKSVNSMYSMFSGCSKLQELDWTSLKGEEVNDLCDMFSSCFELKRLNLSQFVGGKVKYASDMFSFSCQLEELNLSSCVVTEGIMSAFARPSDFENGYDPESKLFVCCTDDFWNYLKCKGIARAQYHCFYEGFCKECGTRESQVRKAEAKWSQDFGAIV